MSAIMKLHFILIVLKQIKAVVVVIISMIHMQNYMFPMLLKTSMLKCLIYCQELIKQDK